MRLKSVRLTPTRDLSGGKPRGSAPDKSKGNSKSRYRKDLLFLDATDRAPVHAVVEVHVDIAAAEEEVVGVGDVRS